MTREEAIKWLETFKGYTGVAELSQAFDVAIKVLEQEPCEDAISREDAIKAVYGLCDKSTGIFGENPHIDAVWEALENLTPVLPESKTEVLDEIKAEIESCREDEEPHLVDYRYHRNEGLDMALDIIDKYKAESEDEG